MPVIRAIFFFLSIVKFTFLSAKISSNFTLKRLNSSYKFANSNFTLALIILL